MENEWYNKINDLFELHDFLSIEKTDEKGKPIKVSKAYNFSPNRTKIASNKIEYNLILKRELDKNNITEKEKVSFFKVLKVHTANLISIYNKNTQTRNRDKRLLTVANEFIQGLENRIEQGLENRIEQGLKKNDNNINPNYNKIWFKVGLKFAKGEISLDRNQNDSYSKLARVYFPKLNTKSGNSSRPYINASITGVKDDKNIFYSETKLQSIIDYCKSNKIDICQSFKDNISESFHLDI